MRVVVNAAVSISDSQQAILQSIPADKHTHPRQSRQTIYYTARDDGHDL